METCETDFLVIGSGIAGLSYALKVAEFGDVTIITKKEDSESSTNYAQGGIACVVGDDDSFGSHEEDTLRTGAGLCNQDAVEILVQEGPERVRELIDWGVRFTKSKTRNGMSTFSLGREGGHSRRRILHADDLTGKEIERALLTALLEKPNVKILEDHLVIDLLLSTDQGHRRRCAGAYVFDTVNQRIHSWRSTVTLLASGGCCQVYLHTTNPSIATGDGIAMAFRAGATIANMEFIQFHPTALYPTMGRAFLISEAVRGEGAILKRVNGEAFMDTYHELASLAPRDVVARAVDREMKVHGEKFVHLDASGIDPVTLTQRFPNITEECKRRGIDVTKESIPVVPAAHYVCGGVLTDLFGRTSIPGLFATGETACTGVHGANRLASNSLLEAVVYSHRASEQSVEYMHNAEFKVDRVDSRMSVFKVMTRAELPELVTLKHDREMINVLMWDYVGIVRTNERLRRAKRRLSTIREDVEGYYRKYPLSLELVELRNLATIADLIIEASISRKESRGLHHNLDYPEKDEQLVHDTLMQNKEAKGMSTATILIGSKTNGSRRVSQ